MKRAMLLLVLFTFGGFWFATSPAAGQFVPSSKPPEHFAVVHYGTDPKKLNLTAKSHIRLNPTHDYTVFRCRLDDLPPKTTYYYTIDSENASGVSDGVKSSTKSFTTQ